MRSKFLLACAIALGASLSAPPIARAQATMTEARESARALAERGLDLFEAKKYAEAIEHFRQAEERFHAPTHLLFTARAYDKLGRLLEAQTTYQSLVNEQLANYAPDAFREAQATARAELVTLAPRIPRLEITLRGAAADRARVTVDGKAVTLQRDKPFAVDPGEHTVAATAEGAAPASRTVTAAEGTSTRVELVGEAAAAAPTGPAGPPPDEPAPASAGGSKLPAAVAFGVGGVGVALGAVTGILSLGKVGELEDRCPTKVCSAADQELADSARTLGTVSTIGLIVGGVGVAAGVVLLVVEPAPAPHASAAGPRVVTRVGPGSLSLAGTF